MGDFQAEKQVVLDFYKALDRNDDPADALHRYCAEDYRFRGVHPFNALDGTDVVSQTVWQPLREAFGKWQRRPDIFMGGRNHMDDYATVWVVEMGHLCATWVKPYLGMAPTGKFTFLRYCEFHRVKDGKIAETASYLELMGLIQQAGLYTLPQTGAAIMTPGPRTHDGLLYEPQDPELGKKSLSIIRAMATDLVGSDVATSLDHLKRFWVEDMNWFGPAGIGASMDYSGYRTGHTRPFEEHLKFSHAPGHQVELAEGKFGGFFGYPSIVMQNTGSYMGVPANEHPAEMRLVDLYRIEGDRLAENWIFIDLLHFLKMQGVDLLAEIAGSEV